MFNCYPDAFTASTALPERDVFYKVPASLHDLKNNLYFDPKSGYVREEYCLYRDNAKIMEIEKGDYSDPQRMNGLDNHGGSVDNENRSLKSFLELRHAFLHECTIGGKIYTKILVIYAMYLGQKIPLLIEEVDDNPFLLFQDWGSPYAMYSKSQAMLAVHESKYGLFLKNIMAARVKNQYASPILIPSELINALTAGGMNSDEAVQMILDGANTRGIYDSKKYQNLGKDIIHLGAEKAYSDTQVLTEEISRVQQSISNSNVDISSNLASNATATAINKVVSDQRTIETGYFNSISRDILTPLIRYMIRDFKQYMFPEIVSYKVKYKEIEDIIRQAQGGGASEEQIKELARQRDAIIDNPRLGTNTILPFEVEINPYERKKAIQLHRMYLSELEVETNIRIEGSDYQKAEDRQAIQDLLMIVQTLPEEAVAIKQHITLIMLERILKSMNDPDRENIIHELEQKEKEIFAPPTEEQIQRQRMQQAVEDRLLQQKPEAVASTMMSQKVNASAKLQDMGNIEASNRVQQEAIATLDEMTANRAGGQIQEQQMQA
jgi:hypothetical protein